MELNALERRIARIRLVAIPLAAFHVAVTTGYPAGYPAWVWTTTVLFAVGSLALLAWSRETLEGRAALARSLAALGFDFAIISSYCLASYWEFGTPARQHQSLSIHLHRLLDDVCIWQHDEDVSESPFLGNLKQVGHHCSCFAAANGCITGTDGRFDLRRSARVIHLASEGVSMTFSLCIARRQMGNVLI